MKKTRFIAGLLCIMMVLTVVPFVAMAAPTAKEFDAAGTALGAASILPATGLEFDFAAAGTEFTLPEGAGTATDTTYAADGLTFGDTQGVWKYYPAAKWCPFSYGTAIYFKAKVAEGGSLIPQAYFPSDKHYRMYYTITSEGAEANGASNVTVHDENFKPGSDYVEYLMFKDANNGNAQILLAKGGTATEWTKIVSATTWREGSNNTGLSFSATKTVIPYMAVVNTSATKQDTTVVVPPVEVASGSPAAADFNAAGAALGATSIKATAAAVSGGAVFDFPKNAGQESYEGAKIDAGSVTYDEYGMNLGSADSVWRYQPVAKWCPFNYGSMIYTRVKVAAGGSVLGKFYQPTSIHGFVKFDLTPTAISFTDGEGTETNAAECTPGTGWVEIILNRKTTSEMVWYVRGGSLTEWTQMATSTTWISGSNNVGITFAGKNATVNYCAVVETSDVAAVDPIYFDSVEDIVGGDYATTYNLELDKNFADNMEASSTEGIHQTGDAEGTTSGTYSADGWTGYQWKFLPYAGWEVLSNTTFMTFTAKTGSSFNFQTRGVGGGQLYIDFKNTGANYYRDANATVHATVAPGSDWAEYLIKKASSTNGYEVYIKQDKATGGKWQHIATTANFRTATNGVGITITPGANAANCYIKNVRVHTTDVLTEATSKPAAATQLMYEENFDVKPAYGSPGGSGMSYADGKLVMTANDETKAETWWFNTAIPVGGYAEFRLNVGATTPTITFYDGEHSVAIYNRVNYGAIYDSGNGITARVGDGGDTYRTWRVVRNTETTYSFYTKSDSDTAWAKVAENVTSKEVNNSHNIYVKGTKTYAGTEGVVKFDYMKVYGPALAKDLTLTDGVGTVEAVEGTNLTFPNAVRALVKQGASAKILLFAEIDEATGLLTNIESQVVPAGSDVSTIMYAMEGKKVKVFLWDNATHANLMDVTTLTAK